MQRPLAQPGFWMSALLTLMAVMVQAMLSAPLALLDEVFPQAFNRPAPHLANEPFMIGIINIVAFGVAIAVGLILNRLPLGRAFPWGLPMLGQFGAMALTIVGGDILLSEVDNLFRSIATPPDWLMEAYKTLLSGEGGLPGRIFLLVIVAPITEELFFRGVILRGLLPRFPVWAAIGLSSFLFAAGHVNPWQFVSAFGLGLGFGWFYIRTGSVLICILAHAVSNGLFVLFTSTALEIPGLTGAPDAELTFQPWWLDVLGVVLLLLGILSFIKATPPQPAVGPEEPPVIPPPLAPAAASNLPPVIESPPG